MVPDQTFFVSVPTLDTRLLKAKMQTLMHVQVVLLYCISIKGIDYIVLDRFVNTICIVRARLIRVRLPSGKPPNLCFEDKYCLFFCNTAFNNATFLRNSTIAL